MVFAGVILLLFSLFKERESTLALFKSKKVVVRLIAFAFFGILANQLTYLEAIKHTNSGTATVIQYIGPVIVVMISCFMAKRLPTLLEAFSLVLVIVGTWLLATHGDFSTLYITPMGLFWGLISAFAAAAYTLIPVPLLKEYGSIPVVGTGMVIGGMGLSLINGFRGGPQEYDARYILVLGVIVILGTVIAYTGYLVGVKYCGAVKASMIASVEPVSATLCMVLWLGEKIYTMDIVGFVCILATVFILAKNDNKKA